jgi:hypothetical protein
MEMEKPVSLCLGARKLLHPDIMSERWYPRALLVLLTVPSESTPATAQETYCIEPGMDFKAAEERLMEVGELQSRSGAQGIYRATYQPERGLVTIAASEGAFWTRPEARVEWASLTISAGTFASRPQKGCNRYRKLLTGHLGEARIDTLSGGTLFRWKRPDLQARILCHHEAERTEVILLGEPALLSAVQAAASSQGDD